jgi:predicted hotdog family 3-hydroxylacyl-ACP dehydratase
MAEHAALLELVPHAPPMLWLRRVVAHDGDSTECEACTDDLALLRDARGFAPGYAALELAAQCVAAHARLVAARGGSPRIGLLLGARRFELRAARLAPGRLLRVRVRRVWGGETGPVSFDAELRDAASAEVLAAGRISCFTPSSDPDPTR